MTLFWNESESNFDFIYFKKKLASNFLAKNFSLAYNQKAIKNINLF